MAERRMMGRKLPFAHCIHDRRTLYLHDPDSGEQVSSASAPSGACARRRTSDHRIYPVDPD
jgi:hypothetical protein